MRKVYHKIIHIAGNVITVEADDVSYNELAEVTSARGVSLAQVIRLADGKVSLQVFAGAAASDRATRCVPRAADAGFEFGCAARARVHRPRRAARRQAGRHLRHGRHRRTVGESGQAHHPAQHDPHEHSDDRRVQHAGRVAEAAIFSIAGEPYNELLARIARRRRST